MTEKEVLADLCVDLGVAFQKAAERLYASKGVEKPKVELEEPTEEVSGIDLSKQVKELVKDITQVTDVDVLKAAGKSEQGGKKRKGILQAIKGRIEALTEDDSKELEETPQQAFTVSTPATKKDEIASFKKHWAALTADQQDQYLSGEIDSLGDKLASDDDLEDLDDGEEETSYTQEEVRDQLKAFAKKNGKEKAYAVLAKYEAKKVADLAKRDYAPIMKDLKV